jgi:hypothetical protein
MTNSERAKSTEKAIDEIVDLLGYQRIAVEVDQHLDQAVQAFRFEVRDPLTESSFREIVSEFVRHVYEMGLRLPRRLPGSEALSEAIFLLEAYYQGGYTEGYDGALFDAMQGNLEGLELVLSRLGESIKTIERSKYVNWVFADHFDRLDWEARRQLVTTYMKRYGDSLTPALREINPARLVDHFRALIDNHVFSNDLLKQVLEAK